MPRKRQRKGRTDGGAPQPRPTESAATATHSHSYQNTRDTVVTVSQGLIKSPPNIPSQPAMATSNDDFVISVYKAPKSTPTTLNNRPAPSSWRQREAAKQFSPAIGVPSALSQAASSSAPPQISYTAVPPPASLTGNRQNWRSRATNSRAPIGSSSSDYSTFKQPRLQRDMNGASPSWQGEMLPDLMENLQINTSLSNFITPLESPSRAIIEYSPEYMLRLRSFVYSKDILQENGYIFRQLSEEELERKKRCAGCGKSMPKRQIKDNKTEPSTLCQKGDKPMAGQNGEHQEKSGDKMVEGRSVLLTPPSMECNEGLRQSIRDPAAAPPSTSAREPIVRCKFHNGVVISKKWSCCGNHVSSDPCTGKEFHVARQYPKGELEREWKFHTTINPIIHSNIRPAVAIDCEMGTAKSGDSQLIRVTLIDYFSSAVLVDSLVYPDVQMEHFNTRFSGVTRKEMEAARVEKKCFMGNDQARKALWRFIGPDTVVVGHSAHNDLTALRWIHQVMADTWLIESTNAKDAKEKAAKENIEAELATAATVEVTKIPKDDQQPRKKRVKGSGALSLKTLSRVRLGREIQTRGNKGHDSLEDAIAARDLAHWNVMNRDDFKALDTLN